MLSLIPAKYYYDDATQDQWQQQKKSKKEIQENKRAKLDPSSKDEADDYTNSHASAKDVMSNKAKNAKRVNLPSANKFQQQKAAVSEAQDAVLEDDKEDVEIPDMDVSDGSDSDKNDSDDNLMPEKALLIFDDEGNEVDAKADAAASSGATGSQSQKQKKSKVSPEEQQKRQENLAKLRAKLSDKINTMKEKRKAPGSKSSGVVPKSREQILADRKKKEELKRLEKLKRKSEAIEDDDSSEDEDDEDEVDQDQDESRSVPSDVLFGNIVFGDGSRVTSDLTKLRATADKRKLKGPANNDLKAHLKKLEAKKARLLELSPEEQTKQKDKDQWNKVMAQAEGIKVKDDEKLLRKALKRKEKQKLKSEIEWRERKQVVKDTVAARAKRREENLKSRRENKGKKSKNQPRLKKFTGSVNKSAPKKKRAGFEGSAKSQKKNSK